MGLSLAVFSKVGVQIIVYLQVFQEEVASLEAPIFWVFYASTSASSFFGSPDFLALALAVAKK